MNVRAIYITREIFESYLAYGRLYEGFVIGVGYAYIESKFMQPPNANGYVLRNDVEYSQNQFGIIKLQCLDSSLQMVELSVRAQTSGTFAPYMVYSGDSLSIIAKRLGTTVEDIVRWNGIKNPNSIYYGQILMIDINKAQHWNEVMSHNSLMVKNSSYNSGGVSILGLSCNIFSLGIETKLLLDNYRYLANLARNGQFLGTKNGLLMVMDKSFLSTHRMINERTLMKDMFLKDVSKLKLIKNIGRGASAFSTAISLYNLGTADNSDERWLYGIDSMYGIVGFFGPIGAFISLNYTLGKEMFPAIIDANIERADRISRGDYSMAWYIPGRSVR